MVEEEFCGTQCIMEKQVMAIDGNFALQRKVLKGTNFAVKFTKDFYFQC